MASLTLFRLPLRHGRLLGSTSGSSRLLMRQYVDVDVQCRRLSSQTSTPSSTATITTATTTPLTHLHGHDLSHPDCNVPPHIAARVGRNLHHQDPHPLFTIQHLIQEYFHDFDHLQDLSQVVSTEANFDSLLIPKDHVSRSKSDTYYLNREVCLRTHTSAHETQLLKEGRRQFLVTGDVYRRDEIDASHYPIFHQMEGVKLFDKSTTSEEEVLEDLKASLGGLATKLFGDVEMRWVEAYFPFTHPSVELEIYYNDQWLEVLGCGVMQPKVLEEGGHDTSKTNGWAFGLGLERLAMVLFEIPDIRLFWSDDERFWKQFKSGQVSRFQPYSKYPPCYKDISFWTPDQGFHVNDLNEVVRQLAGDLAERVELIDQFTHPKTQRESHCYRITYRSMDRSLTNAEIDALQEEVRKIAQDKLQVELR
jgi:phenylalanyl-tRNA synthetase alpha chain